ncbi:hypothetical protein RRG08_053185 [Elysia crispata]|uniref:Transmembrane protein n=1 Tax=Elysia crispata TaxID=231223 RepID=A0AAE0YSH1_9GAST|nr:hypothetical protein RRG08_053185 [Elysia crispata]
MSEILFKVLWGDVIKIIFGAVVVIDILFIFFTHSFQRGSTVILISWVKVRNMYVNFEVDEYPFGNVLERQNSAQEFHKTFLAQACLGDSGDINTSYGRQNDGKGDNQQCH